MPQEEAGRAPPKQPTGEETSKHWELRLTVGAGLDLPAKPGAASVSAAGAEIQIKEPHTGATASFGFKGFEVSVGAPAVGPLGVEVGSEWAKFKTEEPVKLKDFEGTVRIFGIETLIEALNYQAMAFGGVDVEGPWYQGDTVEFEADPLMPLPKVGWAYGHMGLTKLEWGTPDPALAQAKADVENFMQAIAVAAISLVEEVNKSVEDIERHQAEEAMCTPVDDEPPPMADDDEAMCTPEDDEAISTKPDQSAQTEDDECTSPELADDGESTPQEDDQSQAGSQEPEEDPEQEEGQE